MTKIGLAYVQNSWTIFFQNWFLIAILTVPIMYLYSHVKLHYIKISQTLSTKIMVFDAYLLDKLI